MGGKPVLLDDCSMICTSRTWNLEELAKDFSEVNGGATWYDIGNMCFLQQNQFTIRMKTIRANLNPGPRFPNIKPLLSKVTQSKSMTQ